MAIKSLDMVGLKRTADEISLVFPNDHKVDNVVLSTIDQQSSIRQSQISTLVDGGVEILKLSMIIEVVEANANMEVKIPSLVRVTAFYKDGIETEGFKRVELHIVGLNNDLDCNVALPVQLSSLASVDKTTTCLFVSNFLDKFYLEKDSSDMNNIKYSVVLTSETL